MRSTIVRACHLEEVTAASSHVIDVQQPRRTNEISRRSRRLRFDQWPRAQVFPIDREQAERVEARPVSPKQQILEVAAATPIEADDLAIDDGACAFTAWASSTELRPPWIPGVKGRAGRLLRPLHAQ